MDRRVTELETSIQPVILCGGAGTRLWPASRSTTPKQFAHLVGDRSTFQEALLRTRESANFSRPLIVTSSDYQSLAESQLREINVAAEILLEPVRRDSGPAILAACMLAAQKSPDTPLLFMAADHVIQDPQAFEEAVLNGIPAARAGRLVTFGITPTRPETGYGYISPGAGVEGGACAVANFFEKPDAETAASYIDAGYLWNAGIFLFCPNSLIEEYRTFSPDTAEAVQQAVDRAEHEATVAVLDAKSFACAEAKSVDYAVLEHTKRAAVVETSCGWSDVGTWHAIWDLARQDSDGNVKKGRVEIHGSKNCFVSTNRALTSVLGVDDLIVVADRDAILVADRKRSAEVKGIVEDLRAKGHPEADAHVRVLRPWGWFEIIDAGEQFQVKRILVHPGGRLSLQKHKFRAEHWVVVKGSARVTVDDRVSLLGPGEHVHIPLGSVHRLENPGNTLVEIIEVQNGNYLGEDDIVRLEDAYHRV